MSTAVTSSDDQWTCFFPLLLLLLLCSNAKADAGEEAAVPSGEMERGALISAS
jgi:hypothetical protein